MEFTKKELIEMIWKELRNLEEETISIPQIEQKDLTLTEQNTPEQDNSNLMEAVQLSKELKRMKQLLDFRNPLLGEKN